MDNYYDDYEEVVDTPQSKKKILVILLVSLLICCSLLLIILKSRKKDVAYREEVYVMSALNTTEKTNKNVKIIFNIIGDYYTHTVLPDGGEIVLKNFEYEVKENGIYHFKIMEEDGVVTEHDVLVDNIDKSGAIGSCVATKYNDYNSVSVTMYERNDIIGYSFIVDGNKSNMQVDATYKNYIKNPNEIMAMVKYGSGEEKEIACEIVDEQRKMDVNGIKERIEGQPLQIPISNALASKGYTVNDLNMCIYEKVKEAGPGTRYGVVAAGFYLMKCVYDMTGGYTISYNHTSGKVEPEENTNYCVYNSDICGKLGINTRWGTPGGSCTKEPCFHGLNCASFVRWSFCNGGMDLCTKGTAGAGSLASKTYFPEAKRITIRYNYIDMDSYDDAELKDTSVDNLLRMLKPGDIIRSHDGRNNNTDHVMLIIGRDDNGLYIAEDGKRSRYLSFETMKSGERRYRLLYLDEYYANSVHQNGLYS